MGQKMKIAASGLFVFLFAFTPANAQDKTTGFVKEACSSDNLTYEAICTGYVQGLIDGIASGTLMAVIHQSSDFNDANRRINQIVGYCIHRQASLGDIVLVYRNYLNAHGEVEELTARLAFVEAMQERYPCE